MANAFLGQDIQNIYLDSDNVSKVRVYQGGHLMGIGIDVNYDDATKLYKLNLFKEDPYVIPLSRTNCNPFSVKVSPVNPNLPLPNVWIDTVDATEPWDGKQTEHVYHTFDDQVVRLTSVRHDDASYLVVLKQPEDTTFATPMEKKMYEVFSTYEDAFKSYPADATCIVLAFAKSLPYLSYEEACMLAFKHERVGSLQDCLEKVWVEYTKTDACLKALTL